MARYIVGPVVLVALLAIVMGFVRLAPSDPADWHHMPEITPDMARADKLRGVLRQAETGPDGLARLAAVALQTPRTVLLAGSVDEGMMTFVTRSRFWGFPDYTTARQDGDRLVIHARQRFGRSDLGVNRARVDRWLAAL